MNEAKNKSTAGDVSWGNGISKFLMGFVFFVGCFSSFLAHAEENQEQLLPAEVHEMATELLELVEEEFAAGKARTVSAEDYAKHPYWVAVFRLGKAVTPDLREKLQAASELSETENLTLGAALCTFDRDRLDRLIAR